MTSKTNRKMETVSIGCGDTKAQKQNRKKKTLLQRANQNSK